MVVRSDRDALEDPFPSHSATAVATFAVVVAVALPLILYWGRRTWFVIDDWDFLALRSGGSARDLFRPHAGHWTTLPVIVYRVLWTLVGIRSYGAYLSVLVVMHLVTAWLLLTIMRRADVGPWLATGFAAVFVLLGAGAANIVIAFQITFTGSLLFGLAHLLSAMHDGSVARRDYVGLVCGLASLMCSGLGIAMLVAVGVATLTRRGYRIALFHTLPLVGTYVVWFVAIGRDGAPRMSTFTVSAVVSFAVQGIESAFSGLGQLPGVGLAYFVMFIGGVALWMSRHRDEPLSDGAASALGLLAGALFFVASTALTRSAPLAGIARAVPPHDARAGRYVYVIVALALPAVALAAQVTIRWWRPATALVAAMLLISLVGNVRTFSAVASDAVVAQSLRRHILTVPRLETASELSRSLIVAPGFVPVKFGWLEHAYRSGKLASPGRLSGTEISGSILALMIRPTPPGGHCRPVTAPLHLELPAHAGLTVSRGAATVVLQPLGGSASPATLLTRARSMNNVFAKPARLLVTPIGRVGGTTVCGATPLVRTDASQSR